MKPVMAAVHRLARAMHLVSGVFLIAMMVIILVDVIGRAVFGATDGAVDITFTGGVELVSYSLLFMVLFTLPYSVSRGQVIVDLFTVGMSEKVKGVLAGVYTFGFGLLGLGMTIRFVEAVERVAATGEYSQDLHIPLFYIYAVTAFATGVLALRGVLVAVEQISESIKRT